MKSMTTGGGKIQNAGIDLTVPLTFEMSWYFALSMQTFVDCRGGIAELQLSMVAGSVELPLEITYEPAFSRNRGRVVVPNQDLFAFTRTPCG